MEWTAEADAMVLALDAEGLTRREIADRLGVTRNAICGKLHRLKPRCETMPDEPIPDEPTEPLPGPTLGKWWEPPPSRELPSVVAEPVVETPAVEEAAGPSADEITELARMAEKYNLVLTTAKPRQYAKTRTRDADWAESRRQWDLEWERRGQLVAEYRWKIGERVIVTPQDWWGGFAICGDGKWDRPDPTIGVIDMIQHGVGAVRVNFHATPNAVTAWIEPKDFHHLQRV